MLCIIHFIWLVVILAFKHLDPVLRIGKYPVKICFPASVIIASHKEGGFAFVEHLLQGFVVELHFLKANSYLHPSLIGQFENLWQRRTSVVIQLNYEITIDLRLFLGLAFGFIIGGSYARNRVSPTTTASSIGGSSSVSTGAVADCGLV